MEREAARATGGLHEEEKAKSSVPRPRGRGRRPTLSFQGDCTMLGSLFAVLVLAFMLLTGGAKAGEELMPMRAASHEGRTSVDITKARAEWGLDKQEAPASRAVVSRAALGGVEFVGWQDTCVRRPVMVGGEPLEVEAGGGFGLVRPLAARQELDESTFLETLLRELAQE